MWPNPPGADLVTSTENILNGKLHFCAVSPVMRYKGLKYWVHFCSSLKNAPKNICDIIFERAKGRDGTVNRTSDYVDAAVKRGSIKKGIMRNFAKFTRKRLCQSLYFDKVRCYRSATSFKSRVQHKCFLVNLVKFVRTHFLHNTIGRLRLITVEHH